MPPEGDQIRIALSNSSLGSIRFKTPRRNKRSRENLSQPRGRNMPLALGDQHVPFDAWFDDVQVGETKAVQLFCDVVTSAIGLLSDTPFQVPLGAMRTATRLPPHTETIASTT